MGLFGRRKQRKEFEQLVLGAVCDPLEGRPYIMKLLFADKPQVPTVEVIQEAFAEQFSSGVHWNPVSSAVFEEKMGEKCWSFALDEKEFILEKKRCFYEIVLQKLKEADCSNETDLKDCLEEAGLAYSYEVNVFDAFAYALEPSERGNLLMDCVEALVALFDECIAVWNSVTGKLTLAEDIRNTEYTDGERYIAWALNVRNCAVEGTKDMVMDTLGMAALGLPDLQYHYHGLDVEALAAHACDVAYYIYESDAPIQGGDTIDGLTGPWKCQYEESIREPKRCVMDIHTGENAAGR